MKTKLGAFLTSFTKKNSLHAFRVFPFATILAILLSSCSAYIDWDVCSIPRAIEEKAEFSEEDKEILEARAAWKVLKAHEGIKSTVQNIVSELSSHIQALHEARGVFLKTENKDKKLHDCLDKQIQDSQNLLNFLNEYRKVINGTYTKKVIYYDYKVCDAE